jgi:hypothetical protein
MPDHKEVLDRLDRYAKACARNILRKFDLGHDWHRSEDIAQVLFLAGWQVWKAKGDEGLAKHRISSRAKNEAERLRAELKNEPQPVPDLPTATSGERDGMEATKDATDVPERDTGERAATGVKHDAKPMSLQDASAHLLSLGTGDPMRCKDIVDLAIGRGLWTPGKGKTPAATLHAAMSREIKTKGDASRFVKAERGKFALADKA